MHKIITAESEAATAQAQMTRIVAAQEGLAAGDGQLYPLDGRMEPRVYPCADCGKLRTKSEGGTTFTVCDECWDRHYAKTRGGDSPIEKLTHSAVITGGNEPKTKLEEK